jgi:hypothetical protein
MMKKHRADDDVTVPTKSYEGSEFIDLPVEVAGRVFKLTGLNAALESLPFNSQLHTAWRCAVTGIIVHRPNSLTSDDIKLLSKFSNVSKLSFTLPFFYLKRAALSAGDAQQSKPVVPIWQVLSAIAPVCQHLTEISIGDRVSGAGEALRVIGATSVLFSRLKRLSISDAEHALGADDLWALGNLKGLELLTLNVKAAQGTVGKQPLDLAEDLPHLKHVELCTRTRCAAADAAFLAVLPGSVTSATSLVLHLQSTGSSEQQRAEQLVAAVSRLTKLRSLEAISAVIDPAIQRRALGQLSRLTMLKLNSSGMFTTGDLAVLDALPELQQLYAPHYTLTDPFTHTQLRKADVYAIGASPAWAGKTAAGCAISELSIADDLQDDELPEDSTLEHLPLLPQLQGLKFSIRAIEGRFLHLAALLRRQAGTLRSAELYLLEPFMEALPRELPACTQLGLMYHGASKASLQLLAMCSMPQVSQLSLGRLAAGEQLVVAADLGWLAQLPQLRRLYQAVRFEDGVDEVQEELEELLPHVTIDVAGE